MSFVQRKKEERKVKVRVVEFFKVVEVVEVIKFVEVVKVGMFFFFFLAAPLMGG